MERRELQGERGESTPTPRTRSLRGQQEHFIPRKHRCRFFDDVGTPIKPYCKNGNKCFYAHPGDSEWRSASRGMPVASHASFSATPMRSKEERSYETPPLSRFYDDGVRVPKGSLEIRDHKPGEDQHPLRARYPRQSTSNTQIPELYRRDNPEPGEDEEATRNLNDVFMGSLESLNVPTRPKNPERRYNSRLNILGRKEQPVNLIVTLFRDIAKYSNKAFEDHSTYERQQMKLHMYTELSSNLSSTSSSSAAAIVPTLAIITEGHLKRKEMLEDDLHELKHLWEDVFDVFLKCVMDVLDSGVEDALQWLEREAKSISHGLVPDSSANNRSNAFAPANSSPNWDRVSMDVMGRQSDDGWNSIRRRRSSSAAFDDEHSREYKRLRVADADDRKPRATVSARRIGGGNSDAMRTLEELRMKICQQDGKLDKLARENARLKSALEDATRNFQDSMIETTARE